TGAQVATPGAEKSIADGRFPVYARFCGGEPHASLLPAAILDGDPYKIRSLIVYGASLITAWPDPNRWRRALRELDFLVTIDLQLTADAAYADIVLPAATGFEQESYCYYGSALRRREKMIEPVGQSRPGFQILGELAGHLGYGDLYPGTPRQALERVLAGSGFTVDDVMAADRQVIRQEPKNMVYRKWAEGLLRPDGRPGFDTPTGKFEIKSTILEEHGYHGLPCYEESWETPLGNPGLAERYPLILGTGPFKPDMKSCLRAVPDFLEKFPYPAVLIHADDAAERGLSSGDLVVIATARDSITMRAAVTDRVMTGFVYAPVGGGGPLGTEEWKQANVNQLTDPDQVDPISGFPTYKTLLCQIKKKKRQRRKPAVQDPTLGCGS
ncbi:MAG: molybdopterin dinucleotide binding domain-containing protein, partial [Desulfosudaceae bacterium]